MGPTPVYGARAEKPLQNADFAMKQTNICRLSGDINNTQTQTENRLVLYHFSSLSSFSREEEEKGRPHRGGKGK